MNNVSSRIDSEIRRRLDRDGVYRGRLTNEENGVTVRHFSGPFPAEVSSSVDVDIAFVSDQISAPKVDEDGGMPEKNDCRLMSGPCMDL